MIQAAPQHAPFRRDQRVRLVAWLAVTLGTATAILFSPPLALLFLGGAFATWFVVPAVARFALRRNAAVLPGGRSIHATRTPLLGGIAVSFPFVAYLAIAGGALNHGLALGCALMVTLGAFDDVRGVSPRVKILGQVAGALILFGAGYRVPALLIPPFGAIHTTGFEVIAVIFWVVLITNAINLIDGMDGLATSLVLVAAVACALLGFAPAASLVLAGATLGFLRHNLPRARIFLGDAGSLMLGFAVAGFLLNGAGPVNLPVALGVVAIPLGDVALSTVRRWLRGKPIFTGDRGHVHHRLLEAWGSPGWTLAGLAVFAAIQAAILGLMPDAAGLALAGLAWILALSYLLHKVRPRWTRILLSRRAFRKTHLVRHYSTESLRLAEHSADVAGVLERVAVDFDLTSVRLRTIRIDRPPDPGGVLVEEHIDCGQTTAFWSATFTPTDTVLAEEQRTILCDLLRLADSRLTALSGAPEPVVSAIARPKRAAEPAPARPRIHFVADGRERLKRISPFVCETRRRRVLEPMVIYTGCRDALGLTDPQLRELGLEVPSVELDVPARGGILFTARVIERYDALVETSPPAVVVVGNSEASVACAMVAKERGLAVAHVGTEDSRPLPRKLTESLADITLPARDLGRRPAPGQLLFGGEPEGGESEGGEPERNRLDPDATLVVPALEALLLTLPV